jgi:hypothetical protein
MSGFGDYLSWEYVIPAFGCALAYGWFIYRGVQVKRAGGPAAHSRAHLDRLFQMPPGARVTAAWEAVTIPKKSSGQKTIEAASIAFAAVGGVGVEFVGRQLAVACTTGNQVFLRDRESRCQSRGVTLPPGSSSGDALIRPERHPACRRREARPGFRTERENLSFVAPLRVLGGVKGQAASG